MCLKFGSICGGGFCSFTMINSQTSGFHLFPKVGVGVIFVIFPIDINDTLMCTAGLNLQFFECKLAFLNALLRFLNLIANCGHCFHFDYYIMHRINVLYYFP